MNHSDSQRLGGAGFQSASPDPALDVLVRGCVPQVRGCTKVVGVPGVPMKDVQFSVMWMDLGHGMVVDVGSLLQWIPIRAG